MCVSRDVWTRGSHAPEDISCAAEEEAERDGLYDETGEEDVRTGVTGGCGGCCGSEAAADALDAEGDGVEGAEDEGVDVGAEGEYAVGWGGDGRGGGVRRGRIDDYDAAESDVDGGAETGRAQTEGDEVAGACQLRLQRIKHVALLPTDSKKFPIKNGFFLKIRRPAYPMTSSTNPANMTSRNPHVL